MATSGTIKTSSAGPSGNRCYLELSWTLSSQSVANNTSTISYTLKAIKSDSGYSRCRSYSIKRDSTTIASQADSSSLPMGANVTLKTGTFTVTHASDGTFTLNLSVSGTFYSSSYSTGTKSGSWALTTIPRASSVSISGRTMGSNATISISRASSSFTHTLTYWYGSASGTIATGVGTSTTWTIPTSLAAQIPSATSGFGTITCITYNGSTEIGRSTCTFYADVPSYSPTITLSLDKTTSTPNQGTINATVTTGTSYSASISSVDYSVSSTSASVTSSSTTGAIISSPYQTNTYTFTVTATVTDSRGKTASATSAAVTVYGYATPTITAEAYRCDEDGTKNVSGQYATYKVTAASNYKGSTLTPTVTVTSNGVTVSKIVPLATDASKEYTFLAVDTYGRTTQVITVGSAQVPFDIYDSGTEVGAAVGGMAKPNLFTSVFPIIAEGHNSPIGTFKTNSMAANVTASSTYTPLTELTLDKGVWSVTGYIRAKTSVNTGVYYTANIHKTSGNNSMFIRNELWLKDTEEQSCVTVIVSITEDNTPIYLNCNSNSTTVTFVGGKGYLATGMIAVRIA